VKARVVESVKWWAGNMDMPPMDLQGRLDEIGKKYQRTQSMGFDLNVVTTVFLFIGFVCFCQVMCCHCGQSTKPGKTWVSFAFIFTLIVCCVAVFIARLCYPEEVNRGAVVPFYRLLNRQTQLGELLRGASDLVDEHKGGSVDVMAAQMRRGLFRLAVVAQQGLDESEEAKTNGDDSQTEENDAKTKKLGGVRRAAKAGAPANYLLKVLAIASGDPSIKRGLVKFVATFGDQIREAAKKELGNT
ncbi:unnamed protein product, partial [Amoebophrya sp. A25]